MYHKVSEWDVKPCSTQLNLPLAPCSLVCRRKYASSSRRKVHLCTCQSRWSSRDPQNPASRCRASSPCTCTYTTNHPPRVKDALTDDDVHEFVCLYVTTRQCMRSTTWRHVATAVLALRQRTYQQMAGDRHSQTVDCPIFKDRLC